VAYCIDTSAFIEAGTRRYPIDVFPAFWSALVGLAHEGQIVSPEEVFLELRAKADPLHEWARAQRGMFVPLDGAQMVATSKVLREFPRLVGSLNRRYDADAFVVALAETRGLTVVTEENHGTRDRPRIPLACEYFDVPCVDTLAWIRKLRLSF
jgi:predicted nucleic acid-binding protein